MESSLPKVFHVVLYHIEVANSHSGKFGIVGGEVGVIEGTTIPFIELAF